MKILKIVI